MPGQDAAVSAAAAERGAAAGGRGRHGGAGGSGRPLLIGIAVHLVAVVLALISLLICATGGWYAVSRRGVVRVIAVVVVVASLAAFGTGLFFADISIWRVVLIVVLGGASVLAARYALERTRRQLRADRRSLAAPGARRIPF